MYLSDGYLPEALKRLTDADKKRYNQLMQSTKTEKRYFARIMIVGQDKVGKTTLLRRLLKDSTAGVSSTDGVDIAINRCKIDIENGKWTIGKDISDNKADRIKRAETHKQSADTKITDDDDLYHSDLSRGNDSDLKSSILMADNPSEYVTNGRNVNPIDNVSTSSNGIKVSLDTVDQMDFDTKVNSRLANRENHFNENEHEKKPSSLIMPDDLMSNVFSETPNSNDPANLHALCGLWDFAGQREFYATHQAFLTKNAVYLVVANMEEDICKQGVKQCFADFPDIGEYVDFWFDSIHCHVGETTNIQKDFSLDPPIIVVFTCKDKYKEELLEKKREKELQNKLHDVLERQGKYHHLRNIHFVSNMDKSDNQFEQLRQDIFGAVELMNNWGEPMPVVWILLEHLIDINKKNGMNFTNLSGIVKMAKHREINIVDINIVLTFLRFQHKEGNIIFFDDIQDLIILNPKWLVDAFRCLVSDKIDATLQHLDDWSILTRSGKASDYLISRLFQSETKRQFFNQKEDLLKVMVKFDILIKIEETSYYIMPSKMPSLSFDKVCAAIGVERPNCNRTSWLCLKFEFLPPAFFNHLSAWLIQKYKRDVNESPPALYRGICVFDTDRSECEKVFLAMSSNTIAIQLLSFSTETPEFGSTCSILCQELITKVKDITKRYQLTLDFEIHFKCSKGHYHTDTKSYMQLIKKREFFCADHKEAHQSELIYSPWMMHHAYKNYKRKFNLDVEKHLKIGLEVGVGKIPIYKNKYTYIHHGIVITISKINKTFEMVALTGGHKTIPSLIGKNIEPVIETTSIKFTSKDLFYFDYNHLSDKDVNIKNRAEALVSLFVKSGVKYNLREFNCDHFASYCSTGLAFSGQRNRVNWEATYKLDKILEQY
ncbi:uncharacterized protein LOC127721233 isoform X2 [Mytilus californianus]|uniref:uncharacterized protein LOC127721233 isoform X2 n=1 Tax=Mytilus californianus TaxID=6549 RepID=UPI0022475C13|nr:uncharacterized protein LOC127721233 isoform X2 [Mytilus californianus]